MTKEKLIKIAKYVDTLKNRLSSDLPEKHKHRPLEYKAFLEKEIKQASAALEAAKLELGGK